MMEKRYSGIFITFEGGEGAGKTSLINKLFSLLTEQGFQVIKTREPGGTWLGEQIRGILLDAKNHDKIDNYAELLLFLASRAQHIQDVIKPALEAGKIVLCDRFNDSTIAYQGGGRLLGIDKINQVCGFVCGSVKPDCTFFLDVEISTGIARTARTEKATSPEGEVDRIEAEKRSFHERVRKTYLKLVTEEPDRIVRIDANQSEEDVFADAVKILEKRLSLSRN